MQKGIVVNVISRLNLFNSAFCPSLNVAGFTPQHPSVERRLFKCQSYSGITIRVEIKNTAYTPRLQFLMSTNQMCPRQVCLIRQSNTPWVAFIAFPWLCHAGDEIKSVAINETRLRPVERAYQRDAPTDKWTDATPRWRLSALRTRCAMKCLSPCPFDRLRRSLRRSTVSTPSLFSCWRVL